MNDAVHVFIDGASQGNPGPAGIGVAFLQHGNAKPLATIYKYIGETTNNVAEYTALIYALQEALIRGYRALQVHTDSELVAKQLSGEYKVRDATLMPFYDQYQHLKQGFTALQVTAIPREQNRLADQLANEAVESRIDRSLKRS